MTGTKNLGAGPRWYPPSADGRRGRFAVALLLAALAVLPAQEAFALITGGEGNTPIADPGWPMGAAALVNHPGRIAWWEGPPFGGGQWHAECRGDAKALDAVLADVAALDVAARRVVVHDGVGQSVWLNPNDDPTKRDDARVDWAVAVWVPARWEQLRELPADLDPTDSRDADRPAQIDVYTGGQVRWPEVTVPAGLDVIDRRLEAHGFTTADGVVLEGRVVALAAGGPVAARMRLQRVEPHAEGGGYRYADVAGAVADAQGCWVLREAPAGWHRVVVEADGFVPRVAGYARFDGQPGWHPYDTALAGPATVSGRVTDQAGRPLADVDVRLQNVVATEGRRYELPHEASARTDADGRFRIDPVPVGRATVWLHKPGYVRPGLAVDRDSGGRRRVVDE